MDDINEALIASVKALGGSKQVGPRLWPEKTPDAAQRLLLDCLNPERAARLTPEQLLLIGTWARDRGCHVLMQFFAARWSYAEPQPVEPKDEADELRRQYIEAARSMARMAEKIEALDRAGLRVVA